MILLALSLEGGANQKHSTHNYEGFNIVHAEL